MTSSNLFPEPPPPPPVRIAGDFAVVAVEDSLDKLLDYSVPAKLVASLRVGQRVRVPLGRGNRPAHGYVIALRSHTTHAKTKAMLAIDDPRVLLTPRLMELARWMSRYYVAPLGTVIDSVIPSAVKKKVGMGYAQRVRLIMERAAVQEMLEKTKAPKRRAVLARLLQLQIDQAIDLPRLASEAGVKPATVRKLVGLKVISITAEMEGMKGEGRREGGEEGSSEGGEADIALNEEQQRVFDALLPRLSPVAQPLPDRHATESGGPPSAASPGTPGEGWGEGSRGDGGDLPGTLITPDPHPCPLPEYGSTEFAEVQGRREEVTNHAMTTSASGAAAPPAGFSVNLLHGVTGSGKTEVYLQCIRRVVEQGRQAIVLVPEIALTPQTVRRFTARFPRVAILHSGLGASQRHRYWQMIATGQADVVVGARSAVFAPLGRLGIIVVDEEHEPSYKQDTAPRYHGRDVAIKRAQIESVPIILGSATPSLETYWRVGRDAARSEAQTTGTTQTKGTGIFDEAPSAAVPQNKDSRPLFGGRPLIGGVAARLSPSPDTPGEGRGEGSEQLASLADRTRDRVNPHPNPLAEYRERENDPEGMPQNKDSRPLIGGPLIGGQAARVSPSPGTPGEGRGEGSEQLASLADRSRDRVNPHPNPLPEYREREKHAEPSAPSQAPLHPSALPPPSSPVPAAPYTLLSLPHRVRGLAMPHVELIDMKQEARMRRGVHLLSQRLEHLLETTTQAGHQVILLLNRRGYSNFVYCPSCQQATQCKYCDTTMTYHRSAAAGNPGPRTAEGLHTGQLHCHYCLAVSPLPATCPTCGKQLTLFGLGTQRVEEELAKKFPTITFARVDSDTMRSGKDYEALLGRFARREIQVMLGTQMIAKGLDYPNVTLVGVISGDTALALPDFRAAERTFQLITQVAGRAGRGDSPGRVVLQSFMPDDPTIQAALRQDFLGFAQSELAHRREVGLPPFARMCRIILRDESVDKLQSRAEELGGEIAKVIASEAPAVAIKGPMPCAIARIAGYYRYQIVMSAARADDLQRVLARVREHKHLANGQRVAVDVDPMSLL